MADYELVINHPEGVGERYVISDTGLRIGRGTDNDIILTDKLASRRHARIWRDAEQLHIEDLDSRNGVDLNGHRISRAVVQEGDRLEVIHLMSGG